MGIKNEIRMPDGDRSKLDQERDRARTSDVLCRPDVKMLAPPTEVRDLAREKTAKQLEAAAVWVK